MPDHNRPTISLVVLTALVIFLSIAASPLTGHARTSQAAPPSSPQPASPTITTAYFWEPLIPPAGATAYDLAVDPLDAYKALLATFSGLYQTTDAGQTWSLITNTPFTAITDVVIAPADPQTIYIQIGDLLAGTVDGGNSWTSLPSLPATCDLTVAPSNAGRLYVRKCWGTDSPPLFRSDDGGHTWFAPMIDNEVILNALAVAPTDPDRIIAASFDQVFRSDDGGASWLDAGVGTRYFGRPAYDPQPPHTLYLGHWQGLLRSKDDGTTWEDAGLDTEFSVLLVSPLAGNDVLAVNNTAAWQIQSTNTNWSVIPWDAPLPLNSLARSATADDRVIYARNANGFLRYIKRDFAVNQAQFLPVVALGTDQTTFPAPAIRALDQANIYRHRIGVVPLRLHQAIITAAQNHADYHMLNVKDASAWTYGPHGEVEGKPGYTGRWPSDRLKTSGYPWFGGSEVMHFIGDPEASVIDWMATIYHRVIILDPGAHYTGYGFGKSSRTSVDVMDFGAGPIPSGIWFPARPFPLAYPANGQTGVPSSWNGAEAPDPLPPGASRPVGYPFTLQGAGGTLNVNTIELRHENGQLVAVHPNPSDCQAFNCYGLIAVKPLQKNTTYTVTALGDVSGVAFNRQWTFTTAASADQPPPFNPDNQPGPPHRPANPNPIRPLD